MSHSAFYADYDQVAFWLIWLPAGLVLGLAALGLLVATAPVWGPLYLVARVLRHRMRLLDAIAVTVGITVVVLTVLAILHGAVPNTYPDPLNWG